MNERTLIFPHQLFDPHPAVKKDRRIILLEDSLLFGGDPHVEIRYHAQRLILLRAAMKTYARQLERKGYDVEYIDWSSGKTVEDHLETLRGKGVGTVHVCEPTDFLIEKRLGRSPMQVHYHETPMFLTPRENLEEHFSGKKRPFMAKFYEGQRKRLGILVGDGGEPVGGRWSFDDENRKPMPKKGLEIPPDPAARKTDAVVEAMKYVEERFPDAWGEPEGFSYPVSHRSAERWLDDFLETRFHRFGPYEDAISHRERVLFHSLLTPLLNIGLLTPEQTVNRALDYAAANDVPLNSLEGFVRQVIGWREFMRGAYQYLGVECRTGNFWGFEDRPIPESFYRGTTGIEPVDTVIHRVLRYGYCHHIERLMILGNFMLLCGFHPNRVYQWFMELFVDAYDWVMVPNVYGMSQFADGGLFTTKPYISGSNYVRKMSDYGKGDWCETWDGLFWMFIEQHRDYFSKQHRLGMMVRQLDKMDSAKKELHATRAREFLEGLR